MWLESLREMKQKSGLTTAEIASGSGIPEPTLEKLFAGATKEPKLPTMKKLVYFLGYRLEDLYKEKAPSNMDEAAKIAKAYSNLDHHGKRMVRVVIIEEQRRMDEAAAKISAMRPKAVAARTGVEVKKEDVDKLILPDGDSDILP